MVVACPGWPNSRLEVPSSSPASGSRGSGDSQRRVQARPSIRARLEEVSSHYIYVGQEARRFQWYTFLFGARMYDQFV